MSETTLRSARLALASLIAVALVAHLLIGLSRDDGLTIVQFVSLFVVLANLAAAMVMLAMLAFRPERDENGVFASMRGAVSVYMTVTAIVYVIVLARSLADLAAPEPWIDWVVHVVGPLGVVVDWVVNPPRAELDVRAPGWWLVPPAAYLAYSLVRGVIVGWYPYQFLDPATGGYASVSLWSLGMMVVVLGLGLAYTWWAGRSAPVLTATR